MLPPIAADRYPRRQVHVEFATPRSTYVQSRARAAVARRVKRCPNSMPDSSESEIEIRQIFEAEDFGAEYTPELRAQEQRVAQQAAENARR